MFILLIYFANMLNLNVIYSLVSNFKKKQKKKHFNCHTKELLSFVTNSNFQTYII